MYLQLRLNIQLSSFHGFELHVQSQIKIHVHVVNVIYLCQYQLIKYKVTFYLTLKNMHF